MITKKQQYSLLSLIVLIIMILSLTLSLGCSSSEKITGKAIDDSYAGKVSILSVKVVDEKNLPIGDAVIYLNSVYKGKTNSYGESKGTKEVILTQENNIIRAEKVGYFAGRQESVHALLDQKQHLTLTLTKEITNLAVRALDEDNNPIYGATVILFADNEDDKNRLNNQNKDATELFKKVLISDENGFVLFERVQDGPYLIKVSKEEYGLSQKKVEVRYSEHGAEAKVELSLLPWPTLKLIIKSPEQVLLQDAEVSLYYDNDYNKPGAIPNRIEYSSGEGITAFKDIALNQGYVVVIKKEGFESSKLDIEMGDKEVKLEVEME